MLHIYYFINIKILQSYFPSSISADADVWGNAWGQRQWGGAPVSPDKVLGQVYGEVPVEVVGGGGRKKKQNEKIFSFIYLCFFFRPRPPQGSTDLAGRSKSILTIPDPVGAADRTDPADWSQPIGHIARNRLAGQKKKKIRQKLPKK